MVSPVSYELEDIRPIGVTATVDEEKRVAIEERDRTSSTLVDWEPSDRVGVNEAVAMRSVWTKKWLLAAYVLIIVIHFINSLQQSASNSFNPFVTSNFHNHGLTAITMVVANLVGGVTKLPLALFIDVVGRSQGFILCAVFIVLSLLLMAICRDVATYAAAQVFYWTGMNGVHYVLEIFIADTSRLQNRMIWFAIMSLPYVANSFLGSTLGDFFIHHSTWRWGFGIFAIVTAAAALIFWSMFWSISRRASGGRVKCERSNRTFLQSILHWCVQFDIIGLILISGGFSLLLLSFGLAEKQRADFASPLFICMAVSGVVLLAIFAVWEKCVARKSFFPFHLLKDRSVAAACLLGFNNWLAFYCYRNFYSSYLQTVFDLSVAQAGWIVNIYSIVSSFWAVIISFAFKYTDTYKWGAFMAVPVQIIMTGMLIYVRTPGSSIAGLVAIEVIAAFASATLLQIEQIAIMASVPHENLAVGLALLFMCQTFGGAIGSAVSGTLWTQIVPKKIALYLPPDSKIDSMSLYNSLIEILALPVGSAERKAVISAYIHGQRVMLICGLCASLPCLIWMCMLRNYRMSERPRGKVAKD